MDNQNNNDDFLYGGNEQPMTEYEQPAAEGGAVDTEPQPEPQASEPEPQQLPPYGQGFNDQYQYNQNQYGQYNNYNQGSYNPYEQQNTKNTYGIVSLVTGIISVTCCCTSILGLILGIFAIVFGIISLNKKEANKGFVIAGIVMGSIAVLLGIISVIISVYMFSTGTYGVINQGILDSFMNDFPSTPTY